MENKGAQTSHVSPPAALGSAPGLGEAFHMNLNTGQGVYSYNIALPEGVAGHTPKLALEYQHGSRIGLFGLGWDLPLRSIERRLDLGAPSEGAHENYLDGSAEIVKLADGSYAPLVETVFTRYSRQQEGWRIEERDGKVHTLGTTAASRLADPANPGRVQQWLLEKSVDVSGNEIRYEWDIAEGFPYLRAILYAGYAVRFLYEDRPDPRLDGRSGFLRRLTKRCVRLEVFWGQGDGARKIRSWQLAYDNSALNGTSLLASIQMTFYGTQADHADDVKRAPVLFTYQPFSPQRYSVRFVKPEAAPAPPLTDPDVALVNLDQAPLPGVLQVVSGRQYYWRNNGLGGWEAPQRLPDVPFSGTFARAGVAFVDMTSSGKPDLMVLGQASPLGYFENAGQGGWGRFVAYPRGQRTMPQWTSPRLRLTDSDGDGRIDAIESANRHFVVWRNLAEDGWADPELIQKPADQEVDFADRLIFLADMTGDGSQDLVRILSGSVEYWPNLGNGRYGDRVQMHNSPRLPEVSRRPDSIILVDVDGDGCDDLVRVEVDRITVFINRGGFSFSAAVVLDTIPAPIPGTIRPLNLRGKAGAGLVWNSYQGGTIGYVHLEFDPSPASYLLSTVDNGSGLVSEIHYRSAVEDYLADKQNGVIWETNFPFPLQVVGGTKETDTVSSQVTEIQYHYHQAHYETGIRQFQGFRSAERIEKGDESRADTRTVFTFLMAMERLPGNSLQHAALNGSLTRTEIYSLDGSPAAVKPYSVEDSTYDITALADADDGRRRSFLHVTAHRSEYKERGEDLRGEEKTYAYDTGGNVVREVHRGYGTKGGVVQPEKTRTTEIAYAVSPVRWLLGKPSAVVVKGDDGKILAETRYYYDGSDFTGLPLGQADRGLLSRESRLVQATAIFTAHYAGLDLAALGYRLENDHDGVPSIFLDHKRHAYEARGLVIADRDPVGHDTHYDYDPSGLFRVRLLEALGETHFEFDPLVGQPTTITYGDGSVVRFAYDAQGRLLYSLLPGDDAQHPPRLYTYNDAVVPNSRAVRMLQSQAGGVRSEVITYFDGHHNEFQQRVQVDSNTYLVTGRRALNGWGDLKNEFEPTFSPDRAFALADSAGRPARTISYDGLGRLVKVVNFNGGISTAVYSPFAVETSDADDNDQSAANVARGLNNTPHREEFDVFRQRAKVVEVLGSGALMTTNYVVDGNGRVVESRDDLGTLCTYSYDLVGNRYDLSHRAAGRRRLWYDARGKVVRSLDANGNDLSVEIDARGRLRRLVSGGATLEEYVYDDLTQQAYGKLARVSYREGSQVLRYDQSGRIVQNEFHFKRLPQPHIIQYEYDALGREIAQVHGDGTRLEKRLTYNGWVQSIPGILSSVSYEARGLPTRMAYANGVTTSLDYIEGPGRLRAQKSTGPLGQVFEDITYEYDQLGLLLASNDLAPGGRGRTTYDYDPLYQVRSCSTLESGSLVVQKYEYFNHLNLSKLDEANCIFHFDDPLHPDRIQGITAGGAPRQDLTYDHNGNLLTLPGKILSYNEKNELGRLKRGDGLVAEYGYNHHGQRVFKHVDDGHGLTTETFFVGRDVEIRNGQPTFFVTLGERRVAIIQGPMVKFVHSDYSGSTSFFTDTGGSKLAAIAYRPFGNIAQSSGSVDFRTYSLHPFDAESGFYYFKRRYYAPELGRFLTPDPLALYQPQRFLSNPKGLHPYNYVGNDPLNNVDYDGLSFWSVVGAIVGVIVGVALAAAVVLTGGAAAILIGLVVAIGLVTVSYVIADNNRGNGWGEFFRGFMIGLNAGINAVLASAIFGPVIGIALGVIGFLSAFDTIAGNRIYQGILAYSSWLMPMSWIATGLGLVFFVINLVMAGITFQQWDAAKISHLSINWETGSIVCSGGLIRPAGGASGFDMGNFVFLAPGSSAEQHETGHTLSLAAYGWIFHFVGAIDENITGGGADAFAEHLADSHDPSRADPSAWWDQWDPNHA